MTVLLLKFIKLELNDMVYSLKKDYVWSKFIDFGLDQGGYFFNSEET